MHENGFKLADSQSELTPMQKYIYLRAKEYHEEESEAADNHDIQQGQSAVNGFR